MKLNETLIARGRILESDQAKLPNGVLCRGVWPICNIGLLNQNNRMYEKAVWDKVLADKSMMEKMENRTLFGQAEHPEKTQSDLQLTSHVITGMFYDNVNEGSGVVEKAFQQIDVLDTPCGRIINTLIEAGCQVGVSTRAEGDLEEKTDDDGNKFQRVIPESYNYVTTDFTADPSTFNVAPIKIESNLRKELQNELALESLKPHERQFAVALLESVDAKSRIDEILSTKMPKDLSSYSVKELESTLKEIADDKDSGNLPFSNAEASKRVAAIKIELKGRQKSETIESLINKEMIALGVGVVIKEGKFNTYQGTIRVIDKDTKGKIIGIKEGMISIELEDGTQISAETSAVTTDNVEITFPEVASEMPEVDVEVEELEAEAKPNEELPGQPSEESPRDELPNGFESKQIKEQEGGNFASRKFESYDQMVDWMQLKMKTAQPKDMERFTSLVRTKLLNEKIIATSTDKEIRALKIKEASSRAEKDKALEMIDEISAKLASITEKSPLEVRILAKKLKEAKYTTVEVQALCRKLEERQTALNEVKKQFEVFKNLATDNEKKSDESIKLLKESYNMKMKDQEVLLKEKYEKDIVEKYVEFNLSQSGLKIHRNARALLEKCTSVDEVDEVFNDVKEAMKRAHFVPGRIDEVKVEEALDPKLSKIKSLVKSSMSNMR